jgi:hypothetical protein
MPIQQTRTIAMVECATCPDCEKIIVLATLAPESKRPFVEGRTQGWVIVCRACDNEFPVRSSNALPVVAEPTPLNHRFIAKRDERKRGAA